MVETLNGRPTFAKIDLDALAFNLNSVKAFVGISTKYLAVVKADAYGHGAIECARRLSKEKIDWFGVALPEEGVELRLSGIKEPILCLGSFWPGQESAIIDHDITPVIFDLDKAELLNVEAKKRDIIVNIHVKIDTGMGRIGVRYLEIEHFATRLREFSNLNVDGIMTHFAAADDLSSDFTATQIRRFDACVAQFRALGFDPTYIDLANSPGAIAHPESRRSMVRLGGVLYGLGGDVLPAGIEKPDLRPVMSIHSKIALIKPVPKGESIGYGRTFVTQHDSIIASVPIGYHDGYGRNLTNNASMIINGKFAPVVGRVSMDWVTLDVTDIEGARIGNAVTIIGTDSGLTIKAEDLAAKLSTISYEVTCGISSRVPRIFEENT